jgi:hypothetical protein
MTMSCIDRVTFSLSIFHTCVTTPTSSPSPIRYAIAATSGFSFSLQCYVVEGWGDMVRDVLLMLCGASFMFSVYSLSYLLFAFPPPIFIHAVIFVCPVISPMVLFAGYGVLVWPTSRSCQ